MTPHMTRVGTRVINEEGSGGAVGPPNQFPTSTTTVRTKPRPLKEELAREFVGCLLRGDM